MKTDIGRKTRGWKAAAAMLVLAASGDALAFDGTREGWQLNLSGGIVSSSIDFEDSGVTRRLEDGGSGPLVSFSAGFGITERFALHLASYAGSHTHSGAPDYGYAVLGPGAIWWLYPDSRNSPYLSVMLGASVISTDDELPGVDPGNDGDASGAGVRLVLGYELVNQLRFEVAIVGLGADDGFVPDGERLSLGGTSLSIGYAWY